ncbi:MAG: 2-amino-4-hydroxy-6-hydroxymethyldihydropteridine diphosphokinase [Acidobacteriia bacterium]|nr:2-amino-4-hydroxy-6-hydroxymethyldihydropteridine diphosphokinase [Terriglobia bacterium]
MKTAYLSFGSNLGDRRKNLEAALEMLAGPRLRVLRVSSYYETEPVECTGQPYFLNAVAEVETSLFPMMLLALVERVEKKLGRRAKMTKGARTIDIDILLYGKFVVECAKLIIPHARMAERRFVLAPMVELAPDLRHPALKKTMRELLAGVKGQVVKRV